MQHQLLSSEVRHLRRILAFDCRQRQCGKDVADVPTLGVAAHESHGDEGKEAFHGINDAG